MFLDDEVVSQAVGSGQGRHQLHPVERADDHVIAVMFMASREHMLSGLPRNLKCTVSAADQRQQL